MGIHYMQLVSFTYRQRMDLAQKFEDATGSASNSSVNNIT